MSDQYYMYVWPDILTGSPPKIVITTAVQQWGHTLNDNTQCICSVESVDPCEVKGLGKNLAQKSLKYWNAAVDVDEGKNITSANQHLS